MTPLIANTPAAMRFIRRALELRPICASPKCEEPSVAVVAGARGEVRVECVGCRQRRELAALPSPPPVERSETPDAARARARVARYRVEVLGKVPRETGTPMGAAVAAVAP
ncbi:hypothetical protein [Roseomonas sp. WA12]